MIDFSSPKRYSVLCPSIFTPGGYREEKQYSMCKFWESKKRERESSQYWRQWSIWIFFSWQILYKEIYIIHRNRNIIEKYVGLFQFLTIYHTEFFVLVWLL